MWPFKKKEKKKTERTIPLPKAPPDKRGTYQITGYESPIIPVDDMFYVKFIYWDYNGVKHNHQSLVVLLPKLSKEESIHQAIRWYIEEKYPSCNLKDIEALGLQNKIFKL